MAGEISDIFLHPVRGIADCRIFTFRGESLKQLLPEVNLGGDGAADWRKGVREASTIVAGGNESTEEKMKKRLSRFFVLGLFAIALSLSFKPGLSPSASAAAGAQDPAASAGNGMLDVRQRTLVVDVACDATTFRLNKSGTLLDARRGDGFIVEGKIYPGYTISPGGTMENPGQFDPRTAPGSLGQWVCRGAFAFDIGEILQGAEPHLFSTQYHLFSDGRGLVHDGPEGGGKQLRALTPAR
jgi:hypothetical protein